MNNRSKLAQAMFRCSIAVLFAALPLAAFAITTDEYRERITRSRAEIEHLLAFTAESEQGVRYAVAEKRAVGAIRDALPVSLAVDVDGQTVQVSNDWLHTRLNSFETETSPEKRAIELTETDELLSAISEKLAVPPAEARSKDEEKRKLAEILARAEYQKPAPKGESWLSSLLLRFLQWIQSLFPDAPIQPPDGQRFASFAYALQVILFVVIGGILIFLVYKFAPLLFPKLPRRTGSKKSHRTILGERISADATSEDLFSEAERLAREGEMRAAIRKGYIALLCELSDKNVIALEQHKTNRDYLRDIRPRQNLFGSVRSLTSAFERHWYGFQHTAEDDWNEFREGYKKAVAGI